MNTDPVRDPARDPLAEDVRLRDNARVDAHKDPATLEREIDQTRADMGRTLGALERKLSPGQLLDEAMGFAKDHAGEFASNLGRAVKDNPMPALLTAVGVVWMLASNNRPRIQRAYNYDRFEDGDFQSGEFAGSESESSSWSGAGQRAKSSAQDAVSGIGERARSAVGSIGQGLSSSREAMRERLSKTSGSAQAQGQRMREGVQNLFEDQPLVIGALGVAIGAAIGAALPRTEQEDRVLGEARDKTLSAIKEQGSKAYEQVRDTANRVGERVGEEVNRKKSELEGQSAAGSGSQSAPATPGGREERKPL